MGGSSKRRESMRLLRNDGCPRLLFLATALLASPAASPQDGPVCDASTAKIAAHLVHGRDTPVRLALDCRECHAPTTQVCAPGQVPGQVVVFGELARADGASPVWDASARTCSGVYCHGATLLAPPGPMAWAFVEPDFTRPPWEVCSVCHGYPPPPPHAQLTSCQGCHTETVLADGTVDLAGGKHLDGALQVEGGGCGSCHAFPPPTGAHVAHFGLSGETVGSYGDLTVLEDRYPSQTPTTAPAVYAFGCGLCHPIDPARHRDGVVQVEVAPSSAPAGSLKARASPTAAFDPVTGRCSGIYCHSSGQAEPSFVASPGWNSGEHLGCDACHGNPPRYVTAGAGAAGANSHLGLADDGWEYGHFLSLPGPFHSPKHGGFYAGEDAAPITCQTCHFDTTDPASTGPSGFYWLDTAGDYQLPGGDPGRLATSYHAKMQCTACHGPDGAPEGTGRVLPLRHVNGSREVVFDARGPLPSIGWLPAAPNTPALPYWLTNASPTAGWPSYAVRTGTTLSFDLSRPSYDPATKTCSNVACHLAAPPQVWGAPYQLANSATCLTCHPM